MRFWTRQDISKHHWLIEKERNKKIKFGKLWSWHMERNSSQERKAARIRSHSRNHIFAPECHPLGSRRIRFYLFPFAVAGKKWETHRKRMHHQLRHISINNERAAWQWEFGLATCPECGFQMWSGARSLGAALFNRFWPPFQPTGRPWMHFLPSIVCSCIHYAYLRHARAHRIDHERAATMRVQERVIGGEKSKPNKNISNAYYSVFAVSVGFSANTPLIPTRRKLERSHLDSRASNFLFTMSNESSAPSCTLSGRKLNIVFR